MPLVNGKKYPYTGAGMRAAAKARKKSKGAKAEHGKGKVKIGKSKKGNHRFPPPKAKTMKALTPKMGPPNQGDDEDEMGAGGDGDEDTTIPARTPPQFFPMGSGGFLTGG